MANDSLNPRESAKAQEREVDDGTFLGGTDFPPNAGGPSDPDADPNTTDPSESDLGNLDTEDTTDDAADAFEWPEGIEVPSRLKDKSPEEIVKYVSSMQTELGRQGTELGDTRSALRELMQAQLLRAKEDSPAPDDSKVTLEDLQDDPDAAIDKRISKALKPLDAKLLVAEVKAQTAELNSLYPGFMKTVESSEFKDWVEKSEYRSNMLKRADAYDFDAAAELFQGFSEFQTSKQSANDVDTTTKARSRATVTGKGGGGGAKRGKTYRYADIAKLYTADRERYNQLYPEFEKAESEGRIK